MTHPLGDERDALGLEDDFLTVEQLAQLRQVTPAAVRAQLRAGNLAGQQVLQGQRTVWRIPVSAAQRYLDRQGAASPTAERDPAVSRSGMPREAEPPPEESTDPEPARPAAAPTPPAAGGSASAPVPPVPASPAPASPAPAPSVPAPSVPASPAPAPSAPAPSARVAALEAEVRRLRRQLSALAEAHRRLLDAVTADLAEDPLP